MCMKSMNLSGKCLAEDRQEDQSSVIRLKNGMAAIKSRRGFGTVEIVLIIAVLISLALLFRSSITSYAKNLMTSVFTDNASIDIVSGENTDE